MKPSARSLLLGATLTGFVPGCALAAADPPWMLRIEVDDAIQPVTSGFIREAIQEAEAGGAELLILELDTPGGLVAATEEVVEAILKSEVPILVFVGGAKAASAGFFITIASDVAVMAPGTRIGAAHPVGLGIGSQDEVVLEKVVNDLAAYARTIAANRGRNVALAEQAVRDSRSFTEAEALADGLIDFVCRDLDEILERVDGRVVSRPGDGDRRLRLAGAEIREKRMGVRQRVLSAIADPTVSFFLLGIGILGIYLEFSHPGVVLPGVLGGIALLLFAFSVQILPVNYVGLLFLVLGLVLFLLEIKVVSYGMLSVGGLVCFVFGGLILFDRPLANFDLRVPIEILLAVTLSVGLLVAFLTWLVVAAHRRRVRTGQEGLIAETGTALTEINPEGRVFVHGEYWNARSERPIGKGSPVRVVEVRGLLVVVEEVPAPLS